MPSKSNECSICMEVPQFSTVETNCGHTFCFECYSQHVDSGQNYSHKCPCCRKAISEVGDNIVKREEYLRNLPAHEPTTELNNDNWEIFPSEDNNAIPALNNTIINALHLAQRIRNSNQQASTVDINQSLNVNHPVSYNSDNIPFRPHVRISSSSIRRPPPWSGSRIKPPKYDLYPGYQGCWNNKGHPDKRTKEWREWGQPNHTNL